MIRQEDDCRIWHRIDLGGYTGGVMESSVRLRNCERAAESGDWDAARDALGRCKSILEEYMIHYRRMDIDALDERFSAGILRGIRDEVLPALQRNYESLESALDRSPAAIPAIRRAAVRARGNLRKMSAYGRRFADNPRYQEYSATTHELDRHRLFRERYIARFSPEEMAGFEQRGVYHPELFSRGNG